MNLLILDQFSDPGGAQQVMIELLPAIRERGWRALVGMPGQGAMFGRVRALGFQAEPVECGPYRSGRKSATDMLRFMVGTPLLAWQIRRLAAKVQADLVYVNGPRLLPGVAMACLRQPVVFHSHSFLFQGNARRLAGESLQRAGAWVVGSCNFVAEPWREYVGDRVSVVFNGVPGPASEVWTPKEEGGPMIGCMGRIAREKGQLDFLRSAGAIWRAIPSARFALFGAALFGEPGAARYEADVRAAAAGLPVEFTGWVRNVYQALARLDLLLVPSGAHEATTRVILEAFAAGVPVIAFRSGGIPEVVEDGKTGVLVGSSQEMGQAAVELLGHLERLAALAAAGRESWKERFSAARFHQELLDLLAERVRHHHRAPDSVARAREIT
jgi:glycosyltransferase involved in cell wall biosynthesis